MSVDINLPSNKVAIDTNSVAIESTNQLLTPTHFKLFLLYRLKICNYASASEPAITSFLVAI